MVDGRWGGGASHLATAKRASLGADQVVYAVTSKVFVVAARRVSLLVHCVVRCLSTKVPTTGTRMHKAHAVRIDLAHGFQVDTDATAL